MSPFTAAALGGAAVLVLGWLVISFLQPGRGRTSLEWIATTGMYVALASWFVGLTLGAYQDGRTFLLAPFGFLAVLFSLGLLVSTWRTLAWFVGGGARGEDATH